jgi:hypothetical protein
VARAKNFEEKAVTSMRALYVSWMSSSNERDGHCYWVPQSLIEHKGPVSFDVATRKHVNKPKAYLNVLSSRAHDVEFSKANRRLVARETSVLSQLIKERRYDWIVFYEGGAFSLEICLNLASKHRNVKFLFNFFYGREWLDTFERSSLEALSSIGRYIRTLPNLIISAETPPFCRLVEQKMGIEASTFPVFTTVDFQLAGQTLGSRDSKNSIIVSVGTRDSMEFAKKLAEECKQNFPELSVVLVIQPRLISTFEQSMGKLRKKDTCYELIDSALSSRDYGDLLDRALVWVFTYKPQHYSLKSSGRLEDCLYFGVTPIFPAGTALEDQLTSSGHASYSRYTYGDVSSAVKTIQNGLAFRNLRSSTTTGDFSAWLAGLPERQIPTYREQENQPIDLRMPNLSVLSLPQKKFSLYALLSRMVSRMGLR